MQKNLFDVSDTPIIRLKKRMLDSHKGNYGHILIIGGHESMAGAPALAGMAALRAGAGKVSVATPRCIAQVVAGFHPCLMTKPIGNGKSPFLVSEDVEEIQNLLDGVDVVAIGPGMGRNPETIQFIRMLYEEINLTVVVDADALHALNKEILDSPPNLRVLTPHSGEFEFLTGKSGQGTSEERAIQAAHLCQKDSAGRTIVVLKGKGTIICDGNQFSVNESGNPGMATGGTGDCLTGMIAALLAREYDAWESVRLAVYLHGLAGDVAVESYGEESMIATDLMESLPIAWNLHGFIKETSSSKSPLLRRKGKGVRKFKRKNPTE